MEEAEAEGEAAAGLQYGLLAQWAVAARRAAREHPRLEAGAVERVAEGEDVCAAAYACATVGMHRHRC